MTSSTLLDMINEFNFVGDSCTFSRTYDIREDGDLCLLEEDSEDAAACVKELGLSYDINARHYSTVISGDTITDMVEVTWKFWKE